MYTDPKTLRAGKYTRPTPYASVPLSPRDMDTLAWLADRGYDAGVYALAVHDYIPNPADPTNEDANLCILRLSEVAAHAWRENIDDDPHAYLACNGSPTLADALAALEGGIV